MSIEENASHALKEILKRLDSLNEGELYSLRRATAQVHAQKRLFPNIIAVNGPLNKKIWLTFRNQSTSALYHERENVAALGDKYDIIPDHIGESEVSFRLHDIDTRDPNAVLEQISNDVKNFCTQKKRS